MTKKILPVLIIMLLLSADSFCQSLKSNYDTELKSKSDSYKNYSYTLKDGLTVDAAKDDSAVVSNDRSRKQKINIGGLFLAPNIGIAYPLGTFASNSGVGFVWGAKLEFAFSKLYPFVPGVVFESQDFKGAAGFISNNLLTGFSTDVIYYGGSIDIILNKFIKSDFTTPVFTGEVKYASVTRNISPDVTIEGITDNESLLTFSTGLVFTLYVFDLGIKYTYADVYSNLNLQLKVHFPLVKF
ncbi:MAG TPA: hypothetical protein PKA90_06815 [Ignavibacteria bacterium]|nr:hypothetical protein [Ignavibacteria bacterium]HMR40128.1 hypothetical protein [Ignavibacteria bacterium]